MTIVEEITRPPGSGLGSGVQIIVLNDDHNTFSGVASILSRYLPGVNYQRGLGLASAIDQLGSSVVWTGAREIAELYWQQLSDSGLTMAPLG